MKAIITIVAILSLMGCAPLTKDLKPGAAYDKFNLKPRSTYNELKKQWKIESSRAGNNLRSNGLNESKIITELFNDGREHTYIHTKIITREETMQSKYAIASDDSRFDASDFDTNLHCGNYCYWINDTSIEISLNDIERLSMGKKSFKLRVHGGVSPKDVVIARCQLREIKNEINRIKKFPPPVRDKDTSDTNCYDD